MEKNDLIVLEIEDLSVDGAGIGKSEGFTFFVKDTVIGDTVEARIMKMKKHYGYARLEQVLEPSESRVKPRCLHARQCGGCQLQAMSYEAQLDFKAKKVQDNLARIGGFTGLTRPEIIGMQNPWRYRNKAQFPFGMGKNGGIVAGFYAAHSHTIVPCTDCCLGIKENETILKIILGHMERYHILPYDEKTGQGLVRHVLIRKGFATGELMVCLVLNGRSLPGMDKLTNALRGVPGMASISINTNMKNTNVIMGAELFPVWGQSYITDMIGGIKYQIGPLSFYQVNPVQTEKLYETVLEFVDLQGNETVWDLYCGIGTISLYLAGKARKVYGVEIVPEAVADAKKNAALNGCKNAEFFVGKAEELLPRKYEEEDIRADVVVLDPPRKGCGEAVLGTIVKIGPEKIVYVSCDSATLSRDLKWICARGYQLEKVRVCDMFPGTWHVETVALLTRKAVNQRLLPIKRKNVAVSHVKYVW